MSNHADRPRPKSESRTARLAGYLFIPVVVAIAIAFAPRLYRHWFLPDDSWPSYQAQVLGTRLAPVGTGDNRYGGYVLYRVEIHAAWTEDGTPHDAWVPTTKTSADQAWLALWASQQGKHCIVRQSPRNPLARLAFFQ